MPIGDVKDRAAILEEALNLIEQERPDRYDAAFEAVDRVVETFGEDGLADAVFDTAPMSTTPCLLSDLLSIAAWQTSDNGAAISRTCEGWLRETSDVRKARVALHLEVFPFKNRSDMEQVLQDLAHRLPAIAHRCAELIEARRSIPETSI